MEYDFLTVSASQFGNSVFNKAVKDQRERGAFFIDHLGVVGEKEACY